MILGNIGRELHRRAWGAHRPTGHPARRPRRVGPDDIAARDKPQRRRVRTYGRVTDAVRLIIDGWDWRFHMERREVYLRGPGACPGRLRADPAAEPGQLRRPRHRPDWLSSNPVATNVCGSFGSYLAYAFRFLIGTGGYLLAFALCVVGGLMVIARRSPTALARHRRGMILLAWCGLLSLIHPGGGIPGGWGGMLGHFLSVMPAPADGGRRYIAGLAALIVGGLLAAEVWVLWLGRKGVEIVTMVRQRGRRGIEGRLDAETAARPPRNLHGHGGQAHRGGAFRRTEGNAAEAAGGPRDGGKAAHGGTARPKPGPTAGLRGADAAGAPVPAPKGAGRRASRRARSAQGTRDGRRLPPSRNGPPRPGGAGGTRRRAPPG